MRTFRVRIVRVREKPGWQPIITDHAVIRYLERSEFAIDIEKIRARMRTKHLRTAMLAGAQSVIIENLRLIIRGAAVVTVVDGPKKSIERKSIKSASRREREQAEEWV